jgi:cell wall assembly regulator SMI1
MMGPPPRVSRLLGLALGRWVEGMDYRVLFQRVRAHLESLQVKYRYSAGRPVIECWDIWDVQDTLKRSLPHDLRQFYLAVGDGLSFRWEAESGEEYPPFANFQIPSLSCLAAQYFDWRELALYSPEKAEEYGFPHTKDPELAKRTAARMWHWLPIIEEGNGDELCIDLSLPSGPVIYHQHDWMDGGTGENGYLLAESWSAFLTRWGSVCFQFPKSLWWKSTLAPGGGVAWAGEQFRPPFRIGA